MAITNREKANISVLPIEIPIINDSNIQKIATGLIGREPLLWYNGVVIPIKTIHNFQLSTNSTIPTLQVFFNDVSNDMRNIGFALDNTLISVYIDSRTKDQGGSPALRPIRMDFKVINYGYLEEDQLFFVQGVANVDGLFIQKCQSYPKNTSFNCLKQLAQELKLGFSSNISGTDDLMTWMNPGLESYQFLQDVTSKAYKDDSTFFTSFIDYYYNLNFIDVETQFRDNINTQKGILTSLSSIDEAESQKVDDLYLVNSDFSNSGYNNVFDTYTVNNQSTKVSLKNGYRSELYYYDKTGNWDKKAGTFTRFILESNTDGKGIVLKSFPKDNKSDGFFKTNNKKVDISPLDIDNTHKHYNYASLLNQYNLDEIGKITIEITMRQPNFNLYKYQKIKVLIFEPSLSTENKVADKLLNQRLSGGWLITGIDITFSPQDGIRQVVTMVKRELSAENFEV